MKILIYAALVSASALPASADPGMCTVTGVVSDVDAHRAVHACQITRERFSELFGEAAPALEIVLREQSGYRVSDLAHGARVYWPTSAALATSGGTAKTVARHVAAQWREVLPHESMHALMLAHFFDDGDDVNGDYGTPLPDWFEEAVAIWAEPVVSRERRVAQARSLPAEFRSLPDIIAGAHPAARNRSLLDARDGGALPPDDRALWAFYPQSIAVLSFVYDAGGSVAVRELASRLFGATGGAAALTGLPGLPMDMTGVIAAWEKWLRST